MKSVEIGGIIPIRVYTVINFLHYLQRICSTKCSNDAINRENDAVIRKSEEIADVYIRALFLEN